jgi:hypothetical protein
MTTPNPITPPPELLREWCRSSREHEDLEQFWRYIATRAAQWGADQELEACCKWTAIVGGADALRATRRPKPPSLKEQALAALEVIPKLVGFESERDTIRRALEALDD